MRNERKRVGESKSKTLCLPFYSILLAMGNPTVDYFSLDVEGAELLILKTIPWDRQKFKVLGIEFPHVGKVFTQEGDGSDMNDFLFQRDFVYVGLAGNDAFYEHSP